MILRRGHDAPVQPLVIPPSTQRAPRPRLHQEVTAELGLSDKTLKNDLSSVFKKLHVSRRSEAEVLYTQQKKWCFAQI